MDKFDTIDDYLSHVSQPQRDALEHIRHVISGHVPDAVEVISYGIPTFKYKGKPLMHFAAFKDHMSIFPTADPIAQTQEKLSGFKLGKGTIQFTLDNQIPDEIIIELLDTRLATIEK